MFEANFAAANAAATAAEISWVLRGRRFIIYLLAGESQIGQHGAVFVSTFSGDFKYTLRFFIHNPRKKLCPLKDVNQQHFHDDKVVWN